MSIKQIDCKTLKKWIDENSVIVIDVREPNEYQESHLDCASLIPLSTIDINALPQQEDKKIVIHCRSGKRSSAACEKLLSQNSSLDLYNLTGGIMAWQNEKLPVVLPIENETCIIKPKLP